jgi:hypothetical protein
MDNYQNYDYANLLGHYRVLDEGYTSTEKGYAHILGDYDCLKSDYTCLQKSFDTVYYDWSRCVLWK